MATWKRLPQECEGSYFFSGRALMTRGVEAALSPEEIAFIVADLHAFVQQENGIDYLQSFEADDGRRVWCIDQLRQSVRTAASSRKTMEAITQDGGGRRGSRWRIAAWTAAALILLLPLIAMQFTDEVVWDVTDFAFFGALLVGVGVTFELAARKTGNTAYRSAVGVALAAAFILVWVNGAVGIVGSEDNDANLMYYGVLAVGLIGAFVARFQPRGMARALFATALAQVLVAVIALIAGLGSPWSGPLEILVLNGFFVALFVGSAWLFRCAAHGRPEWRAV